MSSHHSHAGAVLAVVHEPSGTQSWTPLAFELCGLGAAEAESVAARIAERHRGYHVELDTERAGRPLLRLTPTDPARDGGPLTPELVADLLASPTVGTVPVTGHQREVLLASVTGQGGPGRHVEQLFWDWAGPLDLTRFITAWQSVAEREAVLRASFDWAGAARLVLHDRSVVEVVRHVHTAVGWSELLRQDRARGFELYRPGLLRVSLLDGPPDTTGTGRTPTRVLVTYHRALLDERGARLLVREFYRSYLSSGVLPGGDRRPDIRDHAEWLAEQDPLAAQEFWTAAAPPPDAAVSPGRPGGPPRHSVGAGRIQRRLRPPQTSRLRSWAVSRGAGESSALHVVWALLLYRAAGADGPLPVAFGVHLSGRDISLRAAAGIPGLLGNPLPMTVTVDPSAPLVDLLLQVRDAALDLTPYAWVSGDRIREWAGRGDDGDLTETTVRFDSHPELPENLRAELKAQGIRVGVPQSASGDTSLPVTLVAHYDAEGGLVLTALYDRARFADTDASGTLSQCMQLLRSLPDQNDRTTVADVLGLLRAVEVPRMTRRGPGFGQLALAVLRAGEPHADVVCLVAVPGVTPGAYELLAREHEGPERIVSLSMAGPTGPSPATLFELLDPGRRLVVCGSGPAGPTAYQIARMAAERTGEVPAVVMTGVGGASESARALSEALRAVRARSA